MTSSKYHFTGHDEHMNTFDYYNIHKMMELTFKIPNKKLF
jgi:hypothetical protein